MEKSNVKKANNVDLSKFGLAVGESQNSNNEVEFIGCGADGFRPASRNELFAGEQVRRKYSIRT